VYIVKGAKGGSEVLNHRPGASFGVKSWGSNSGNLGGRGLMSFKKNAGVIATPRYPVMTPMSKTVATQAGVSK